MTRKIAGCTAGGTERTRTSYGLGFPLQARDIGGPPLSAGRPHGVRLFFRGLCVCLRQSYTAPSVVSLYRPGSCNRQDIVNSWRDFGGARRAKLFSATFAAKVALQEMNKVRNGRFANPERAPRIYDR